MAFPADIQSGNSHLLDELIAGLAYEWQGWVPTVTPSGSMTYTSTTLWFARYVQIGDLVHFRIGITGTTGGTASSNISFTLPVAVNDQSGTAFEQVCSAYIYDGAGNVAMGLIRDNDKVEVYKDALANYSLTAGCTIHITGTYEVA